MTVCSAFAALSGFRKRLTRRADGHNELRASWNQQAELRARYVSDIATESATMDVPPVRFNN
jgi:hypothetical protein